MSGYLGSYEHQLDEKGRLSLPAAFRREADERPLVLVQVQAHALTLYPDPAWREVEGRLREVLRLQPEARSYVLGITAKATEVVPDRQGRILIPQRLIAGAGLRESALIVGVIDRVEIWDPDRFAAEVAEPRVDTQRLAAQIFG